jgi:hypothetical protein
MIALRYNTSYKGKKSPEKNGSVQGHVKYCIRKILFAECSAVARTIIGGGAHIHIFVFCFINFF